MTKQIFSIEVANDAQSFLRGLNERAVIKVAHSIDLLATTPFIGRVYDPEFESATPPDGCRRLMVAGTNIEIFYMVDEEEARVKVIYIDDARMNPLTRFKQ